MKHIGQRFTLTEKWGESGEYFLVCSGAYKENGYVCLANTRNGNRWRNAILVKDISRITKEEFDEIKGSGNFITKEEV